MHMNTRIYKPAQMAFQSEERKTPVIRLQLSGGQKRLLAIVAGMGLVAILAAGQFIAGRIVAAEAIIEHLQSVNGTLANENVRLLAARAQLSSKAHVAALVERKLRLFEPLKGQVHRM